jgi:hypothetical protein
MEVTGVLKNEIFRPFASVIVPGSIAVTPYVMLLSHYVPTTEKFFLAHPNAFAAAMVVVIVAFGFFLENIGSRIETLIDNAIKKKVPTHSTIWMEYLVLKMSDEYVGQRYLRTLVLRLKYELSMVPALVLLGMALIWLNCVYSIWQFYPMTGIIFGLVVVILWLVRDSYDGAKLLGEIRAALVAEVRPRNA